MNHSLDSDKRLELQKEAAGDDAVEQSHGGTEIAVDDNNITAPILVASQISGCLPMETTRSDERTTYCILPSREKVFLLLTASFAGMISPFSSSTYYPATPALSRDLHVSYNLINLTISTYLIFQGIGPTFSAAISETHGRRPAFMFCLVVNLCANVGLALQNSYAALLILRCVQSAGSSGTIALANGVVSDVSTRAERGKYIVFATMGTMLGPAFGPVVGGLLSQYLGWRAIFWFLSILGGTMAIVVAVAFRETCRTIVGNGSVPPQNWNRSLLQYIRRNRQHNNTPEPDLSTLDRRPHRIDFLASIRVFRDKENVCIILYTCLLWAGYIAITSILSSQLALRYNFNEVETGLCYLPLGLGSLSSRWSIAYLIDWNFRREAKKQKVSIEKNVQQDISAFDIEKARLAVAMPLVLGSCCCVVAYGWAMEYRTSLAGVLVILFFTGLMNTGSFVCVQALVTDINRERTASASAAGNLARCLLGAGTVAVANPLIGAIGIGWTSSLTAFLWIAFSPCMWLVYRYGHHWRVEKLANQRGRQDNTM